MAVVALIVCGSCHNNSREKDISAFHFTFPKTSKCNWPKTSYSQDGNFSEDAPTGQHSKTEHFPQHSQWAIQWQHCQSNDWAVLKSTSLFPRNRMWNQPYINFQDQNWIPSPTLKLTTFSFTLDKNCYSGRRGGGRPETQYIEHSY